MYHRISFKILFFAFIVLQTSGQEFSKPIIPEGISYSLNTGTSVMSLGGTNYSNTFLSPIINYQRDSSFILSASLGFISGSLNSNRSGNGGSLNSFSLAGRYNFSEKISLSGVIYSNQGMMINNFYSNYNSVDVGVDVFMNFRINDNFSIGGGFSYIKPGDNNMSVLSNPYNSAFNFFYW
jgi:hypothetical protein